MQEWIRSNGWLLRSVCAAGFAEQVPVYQAHIPSKSAGSARRCFFFLQFLNGAQGCLAWVDYRVVSMHAPWHLLQSCTPSANKQSKQHKPPCWAAATLNKQNLSELMFAIKTICWLWLIFFFSPPPVKMMNWWCCYLLTASILVLFIHCT